MVEVTISKPLYGSFCYIRDIYVDKAIKEHTPLVITIPQGTFPVDPVWWKKTGQVMKKVFKQPNNPMILYGNTVPLPDKKGEVLKKENTVTRQTTLF